MKLMTVKKRSRKVNYKIEGSYYLFFKSQAVFYIFGFIPIKVWKEHSIYLDDIKK